MNNLLYAPVISLVALIILLLYVWRIRADLKNKRDNYVELIHDEETRRKFYEDSIAEFQNKIGSLTSELRAHKNTIAYVNGHIESLIKRYVINRITLLEHENREFDESAELLYKLDDLRTKNKNGTINSIDYLTEIDSIFREIENKL